MLQIDHIYEFFNTSLFKEFTVFSLPSGVIDPLSVSNLNYSDFIIFNKNNSEYKIFFYDQEPILPYIIDPCLIIFKYPEKQKYLTASALWDELKVNPLPSFCIDEITLDDLFIEHQKNLANPRRLFKLSIIATSEKSKEVNDLNIKDLYYFFHGFAALDWYRGYYALNYSNSIVKEYKHDFVSYNRIINKDRSYRIYWVSKLTEMKLLDHGQVSFNVTDNPGDDWIDEVADPNTKLSKHAQQHAEQHLTNISKLVIDKPELPGSASADIPREVDALWNIVTETVFYYDKLHLTEKIFKPIVSKQPFMLLAAPGNLEYLRSYGFKTFDGIIDESYDKIVDNDLRIDAVAEQLQWYCNLSQEEKQRVIERLAPIVEHNFHHFYGEFKHIITKELLDNCKTLFKEIGYDDKTIAYDDIYKVLTN